MSKKLFSKRKLAVLISIFIVAVVASVLLLIKNDNQSVLGFIKQINSRIISGFKSESVNAATLTTIEGEDMEIYCSATPYPSYMAIWNSETWLGDYIYETINFPVDGVYTFTVTARGESCSPPGFWPQMDLRIDGVNKVSQTVDSTNWNVYAFSFNVSAGNHEYQIGFPNDCWNPPSDDTNLYIDKTVITYTVPNNPPNKPTGLSQQAGVEGSWTNDNTPYFDFTISDPNSGDTVGYQIQIDNDSNFSSPVINYTWPGSTTNPNNVRYTVPDSSALSNGVSYYWRVRAKDGAGLTSAWADDDNGFAGTGLDFRVDTAAPTITSVTSSSPACNTIRFTVNGASDSSAGLHATPYSFDAGANWQAGNYKDYTGTSYTIPANQIKVRDVLANTYTHPTAVSGTASSCLTAPIAPSNLTFTNVTKTTMKLNWTDNANNEDGYKIYRNTTSSKPGTPIATLPANTTSYAASGLTCGTTYWWWVEAYNAAGANNVSGSQATIGCSVYNVTLTVTDNGSPALQDSETKVLDLSAMTLNGAAIPDCPSPTYNLTTVQALNCQTFAIDWEPSGLNPSGGYDLYRSASVNCDTNPNGASWAFVKNVSSGTYTEDNSIPFVVGQKYCYFVTTNPGQLNNSLAAGCVGGTGGTGANKCPLGATTPACPSAITNLTITRHCGRLTISWPVESQAVSYRLYKCLDNAADKCLSETYFNSHKSQVNASYNCAGTCTLEDKEIIPVNIVNPASGSYYCYKVSWQDNKGVWSELPATPTCEYSYCYRAPAWQER